MIKEDLIKVDIEVSILGIRELIRNAKNPIMVFTLTSGAANERKIEKKEVNSRNPNFGDSIKFSSVMLPFDPLLWPFIEV